MRVLGLPGREGLAQSGFVSSPAGRTEGARYVFKTTENVISGNVVFTSPEEVRKNSSTRSTLLGEKYGVAGVENKRCAGLL